MRKRISLFALPMLLLGLSVVGHAQAAENASQTSTRSIAQSDSQGTYHRYRHRTMSLNDWRNTRSDDPVTVRSYGSHYDGYSSSRAWWKDD